MHVGIAGTGKMGTAIACNLLDRGFRVDVWNVEPQMMEVALAAGARPAATPEALAADVDAVVAMLWDDDVAREVSLGRLIPAAREGQLVIESTTLSPQMYEALATAASRRGVHFLACPVIGSVDGARAGTLALYPGGTSEAFERGQELLQAMGSRVTFTGSPAASGHLKLAGNCLLAVLADSLGELLGILRRAGADRTQAVEVLFAMLERVGSKRRQVLESDAAPRFSAGALLKDLRLAKAARETLHETAPVMECVLTEYETAVAAGLAGDDYIAVALALEKARLPQATAPEPR